jgi:maltose O-acetyltransferase
MKLLLLIANKIKNIIYIKHNPKHFKTIGIHVSLPDSGTIDNKKNIQIGNYVYIGPEPYIFAKGGLDIGSNVVIGPRVTIHTTNHRYDNTTMLPYDNFSYLKKVTIEKNVWIGSDSLICPGVTISEGMVVAMGSVVTKTFPPCSIIGGNPAKILKTRDLDHYKKLDESGMRYLEKKAKGEIQSTYI